jgi:ion channel POLLUX/CASTOR
MSKVPSTLSAVKSKDLAPAKLTSSPSNPDSGDKWFSDQLEPLANSNDPSSPHAVTDVFGISLNNSITLNPNMQSSSKYAVDAEKTGESGEVGEGGEGGEGGEEKNDEENPAEEKEKEEKEGDEGEEGEEEAASCGDRITMCQMLAAYHFDNWIAQRVNQMLLVVYLFLGTIIIMAPIFHNWQDEFFDPRFYNDSKQYELKGFTESLWETYTCLMDPGPHMEMEATGQRVIGALISWFGVVIFSVLTGFVIDAVMEKMEDLKKGRSTVIETDHTLILGWTDKAAGLCREIANANESEGGGVIVVLDPLEKEELETIFENQVNPDWMSPEGNTTKVVFRSGTPLRATDLNRCSANKARSIVILSDYGQDPDLADADILRVLLTLQTLDGGKLNGHVVCEVRDVDNEPLVSLVGGDVCETIVSHDIIGRLMLMAARQPGIARVYNSILGFDGDEFYTEEWDDILGKTWEEVILKFPMAIPIGFGTEDGHVELNPKKDHIMAKGESLIVIAEDDDTYEPSPTQAVHVDVLPEPLNVVGDPEKILFCGWRRDVRDMLLLLDTMVAPGSELHMFNEKENGPGERTQLLLDDGFDINELNNMRLVHWAGNSAVKRHLQPVPLDEYSVAMILADQSRENDMMHSDSHSLSSLLLIRDLQEKKKLDKKLRYIQSGGMEDEFDEDTNCAVVCEILDTRTQETISKNEKVSLSSDFVQSNQMVSQILAMVSEDRNVKSILGQLLGAKGASVKVTGSAYLCGEDEELNFWQLQKRCIAMDKTLLGYQGHIGNEETVINPKDKEVPKFWKGIGKFKSKCLNFFSQNFF